MRCPRTQGNACVWPPETPVVGVWGWGVAGNAVAPSARAWESTTGVTGMESTRHIVDTAATRGRTSHIINTNSLASSRFHLPLALPVSYACQPKKPAAAYAVIARSSSRDEARLPA